MAMTDKPLQKSFSKYLLILIVLISICLQLIAAYQKSFWEDEAFVATFATRGSGFALEMVQWDYHPPLYMMLVSVWGRVLGYNEFGLRLLSVIFSELTLFLCYLLALELFDDHAALATVALLAFSPFFLMFGFMARYYSLAALLAVWVVYSMWNYAQKDRPLFLLFYILGSIAFLYLLFASVVVIAACAVWGALLWIRKYKSPRQFLAIWAMTHLLIMLTYLPGLGFFSKALSHSANITEKAGSLFEPIKRLLYVVYVYLLGETLSPLNPLAWIGGLILFAVLVYAIIRRKRQFNFWLPVSLVVLIVVSGILVSGILVKGMFAYISAQASSTWQNLPARAFYALPFLTIWIGAGVSALPRSWMRAATFCILLVYGFGIYNYFSDKQYLRPVFAIPWHQIFSEIKQESGPNPLVICGDGDHTCYYYAENFGFGGFSTADFNTQMANRPTDVWWFQNNLSLKDIVRSAEQNALDQLSKDYATSSMLGFGEQDPGIRRLKNWFLKQDDYHYRLVLYHFFNP